MKHNRSCMPAVGLVGLGLALAAPHPAHALSCEETMEMVAVGFDTSVLVSTVAAEGRALSGGGASCLESKGAPAALVAAARALESGQPAPAPAGPSAEPVPEEVPARALGAPAAAPERATVTPSAPLPPLTVRKKPLVIGGALAGAGLALLGSTVPLRSKIEKDARYYGRFNGAVAGGDPYADGATRALVHNILVGTGYALTLGGGVVMATSVVRATPTGVTWSVQW